MMPRMIRCSRMAGCGWPAGAGGEALRAASNRQPLLHEFSTDCTTGCISQQDKHQPHGLTVRPAPVTMAVHMSSLPQSLLALQAADMELESCRRRIRALQAELA